MGFIADYKRGLQKRRNARARLYFHRGFGWAVAQHVLEDKPLTLISKALLNDFPGKDAIAFRAGGHEAISFLQSVRGDKSWDTN